SLEDTVICDLNKTLDLSQQPPQNCPKCGKPVDGHYCQGCALLRKKFKEDLFTYCEKMEFSKILPSHPMIIPTLLMLFKSHSLSNKTPIKIPHKVLHKSTTIVVTGVDSDSFMEEIDLSFTPDDPMPSGIEEDDYDSKRDILILEELLSNDSLSLPKNESFHFDIHLSSRPSAKPPNGNLGILNVKVMGGISEHKVPMPRLMITQPTFVPNQEKSPNLLSHQGHKASQPSIVLGYNYY
nr:hypothetical protein [Tanacetum cinerariifolium]